MKIQEMRSGILHLTKKMEMERRENILELKPPPAELFTAPRSDQERAKAGVKKAQACDLDEPRRSVVSFDQTEAGGLTYRQAVLLLNELERNDIAGLCIVTEEAAQRIGI
jgi:hypothetical protein